MIEQRPSRLSVANGVQRMAAPARRCLRGDATLACRRLADGRLHLRPAPAGQPRRGALRRLAALSAATPADAVFILGDLFEVWVGDDESPSPASRRDAPTCCAAAAARGARRLHARQPRLPGRRCAARALGVHAAGTTRRCCRLRPARGCCRTATRCASATPTTSASARMCAVRAWQRALLALPRSLDEARSAGGCAGRARRARRRGEGLRRRRRRGRARLAARKPAPVLVHGHTHRPAEPCARDGPASHRAERLASRRRRHAAGRGAALDRGRLARIAPEPARQRVVVSGWLSRWRRQRTLAAAIPEPLWQPTLARYPFLAARSEADLQAAARHDHGVPRAQGILRRARLRDHRRDGAGDRRAGLLPVLKLGLRLVTTTSSASWSTRTWSWRAASTRTRRHRARLDEELVGRGDGAAGRSC